MEVALTEVAGALPMALSVALAGGISTLRESRRRTALNEAMHELRRPLQTLSLSLPGDPGRAKAAVSSLQMATAALERLDEEINGASEVSSHRPVDLEPLLRGVVERWEAQAARAGRPLQLCLNEDFDGAVLGDEVQISQALDNLINNAIEHGNGPVAIEIREFDRWARVAVLNGSSQRVRTSGSPLPLRVRLSGRSRHGHGLRVVERVARAHGGTFHLRGSATRTEAQLELPLHLPEASA